MRTRPLDIVVVLLFDVSMPFDPTLSDQKKRKKELRVDRGYATDAKSGSLL